MGKARDWGDVGAEGGPGAIRRVGDDPATDIPLGNGQAYLTEEELRTREPLEVNSEAAKSSYTDSPISNGHANNPHPKTDPAQIDAAIIRAFAGIQTEDRLALEFVEQNGLNLRYVAAWGQWLEWTGVIWKPEKTLKAYDLARKICRKAASECDKSPEKKMLSKGKTVSAVEQLARSDRRVASVVDQWDSNHLLFNTPSGDNGNER
jgi:hypothetical protein